MTINNGPSTPGRQHLEPKESSMIGKDGKPTAAATMRFERSYAFKGTDLNNKGKEVHAKILPEVERLFRACDLDGLMDLAELTSPANYKNSGFDLLTCQEINGLVAVALSTLIGEDATKQYSYSYQSHLGQESGDTAFERAAALAGLNDSVDGGVSRQEAEQILIAKNPESNSPEVIAHLAATIEKIQTLLAA